MTKTKMTKLISNLLNLELDVITIRHLKFIVKQFQKIIQMYFIDYISIYVGLSEAQQYKINTCSLFSRSFPASSVDNKKKKKVNKPTKENYYKILATSKMSMTSY